MTPINLQIGRQGNTVRNGRVYIYNRPHYRISFELLESEIMGILKDTWRKEDCEKKAQDLGQKLIRRIKDWYGDWLAESIAGERKLRRISLESLCADVRKEEEA